MVCRTACRAAAVSAALGLGLAGPVQAQDTVQALIKVDAQTLASGYRVSKLVGSKVVNGADQKVGVVDDLIVTPTERVLFVILSVGGFLGIGTKYVVMPFSALQRQGDKIVLPNATRENLKRLPAFVYTS